MEARIFPVSVSPEEESRGKDIVIVISLIKAETINEAIKEVFTKTGILFKVKEINGSISIMPVKPIQANKERFDQMIRILFDMLGITDWYFWGGAASYIF